MRVVFCLILVVACLLFRPPLTLADGACRTWTDLLSVEQKQIVSNLCRSGRPVDEEMHQRFWNLFSDEDRSIWIKAESGGKSVADSMLLSNRIASAFWQSVYETHRNGRTTKVPALEALRAQAPVNRYDESDPWLRSFQRQDRMLDLNWLRSSKEVARYPLYAFAQLNEARFTLRQMERLLRSEWNEKVESWPYPPMNLDLAWTNPWQVDRAALCEADCKYWSLRPSPPERYPFAIYFVAELPDGLDPLESRDYRVGMNLMTDLLVQFEVVAQQRRDADWQGHESVTFASTIFSQSNGPVYIISRLVPDPRSRGLLIFAAWSSTSLSDAWQQFDAMANAVTLH